MSYLSSVLAGLTEGISSALPLSETAHRLLFNKLAGETDFSLLPAAVLLAMAIVFHKTLFLTVGSIFDMLKKSKEGKFRWKKASRYQKMAVLAPVAAIPYWVICFLQARFGILAGLGSNLLLVGVLLILNAGLLFIGDHSEQKHWDHTDMTAGHAIKLGLFQAASFLPGFSRVGMTLCMARNMGFTKECALEFSMMSGILALLGGELISLSGSVSAIADWGLWAISFGATLIAAIGGLLLLKLLVKKEKTYLLMFWSAAVGVGALVLNFIGK